MDWKAIPNYVLLVGLFVAMVTMFSQVNGRIDAMQIEMNRRFDNVNLRFDAVQTQMNRRFDAMNRRFDQVLEVLRLFEGRITRLEEKAGVRPGNPE